MGTMPRPRPPFLHRETTRHGKPVWYVRLDRGERKRIRAEFGTEQFRVEYEAAIAGRPAVTSSRLATNSLAWLIGRYRETSRWLDLSIATRRQRENIFTNVLKTAGTKPYGQIERATIASGRDRRAQTPAQARHFLNAMRGLFRWAHEAGFVKVDPTVGVNNPARPKGSGFPAWTEDDVGRFEAQWPLGTKERVWLDVLLYTGLRRGDAVRIGRPHVRNGVATIRTEKSGGEVIVSLPILPVLATTLAAGPCGDLTFICGANGKPFTKESFGNEFRQAAHAAGVKKSAHGVRKIAATRAANAGATVAQLEAIFGWSGGGMASLYTRQADRQRLAKEAMHKLANDDRTSIPAPDAKVRASDKKQS